jgi:hypothetical protein
LLNKLVLQGETILHPRPRPPSPRKGAPLIRKLFFAAIALVGFAQAQSPSGGVYVITKQAIGGGGGASSAGPYVLVGTLGQAGAGATSGGTYSATIGFQTAPINQSDPLFSNGFE